MIKRNNIFVVITIIANIYAQNYENEFIQVWQDLPWGNGGYFPASSILSMTGPFDADGDEQQEFLITSSWTGAIGNDMGVYEVAGDDSLVLIWYADLMDYGINQASNVSKAEIGDLDNDGLLEVLVIIDVSPDNFNGAGADGTDYDSFSVWEFDSTTNSFPAEPTTTWDMLATDVIEVGDIAIEDIDNDGIQEVAVALTTGWDENTGLYNEGRYMIFSLDQSTTFDNALWNVELLDLSTTVAPGYLSRITDLDNDGNKEVLFVAWEFFRVIIYEAVLADVYLLQSDFYVTNQATHFCGGGAFEANLDGDNTNELYFVTTQSYSANIPYEDGQMYVLTNNGDIGQANFTDNVHWLYSFPSSSFGYDLRGLIVGNADSPMYANPDGPDIYIAGGRSGNIYDFEYQGGDITDPENYLLDTLWSAPDYGNPTSWFRPSKVVTGYFDDDSLGDILIASMDYDNFYAPHLVWIEHDYEEVISIDDEDNAVMPGNIEISAIYPNPFNPTTRIEYKLPKSENVQIAVFNVNGKMVKQLANGYQNNGLHSIRWNAKNDLGQPVPSGVYFITIQSEHNLISQKLLLIK